MKTLSKFFTVTTILLFSFSAALAQDCWQVILKSGDTLTVYRLDSLHDNVLNTNYGAFSFPVDSIAALIQHKEGQFWKNAAIGTGVGVIAGAVIVVATYKEPEQKEGSFNLNLGLEWVRPAIGGLIGAVGGFVVGGVIGASSSGNETYDLRRRKLSTKCYIIEQLLSK